MKVLPAIFSNSRTILKSSTPYPMKKPISCFKMIYHHSRLGLKTGKWSLTQPSARLCMWVNPIPFQYVMNNQTLETTSKERDLGVIVTNKLKFARNCQSACQKANRVLGMIRRTISYKTPGILLPLYESIVRPLVEYCAPAWSHTTTKTK